MSKTINLYTWFGERELDHCPKHFVAGTTPVTDESREWILERLTGRFYIQEHSGTYPTSLAMSSVRLNVPCFENPEEATLYELTWS